MKNNTYQERLNQYKEEISIINRGIKAYIGRGEKVVTGAVAKYENEHKVFKLQLDLSAKEGSMLQLAQLMKEKDEQFASEMKFMKANFAKLLKKAMDAKDGLPKDQKRMVVAYREMDVKKSWLSDEHKLVAFKAMMNILNANSNGKSI